MTSFNGRTGAVQGVSAAVAGTGISVSGATGAVTITNTGVQSFNGATGAVGGVCAAQANTFTALQTFSSGLTATGITTGTITNNSSISVTSKGGTVTLRGITSGTALVSNSITLSPLTTTNLSLNSATGIVDVNKGWEGFQGAHSSGLKFVNYDESFYYSNTLMGNASADRTIYLPDASGTLALTSQLMGAVNGSTAATNAVTSFNGLTGAVGGVSAAVAGTGISVSGATGAVTITNIGVQSFNGNTGAVTGASLGANTFTALNTFNAGISAAGGVTLAGTLQGTTASFTGLVSSTVGFSGSATNLVGNANGLTAGTASRVQIAEGAGTSYYLALVGGTGNTGIFVDTSVPRWIYNASTGSLFSTTGYLEAANLYATTAIYSNTWEGFDGEVPLNIRAPYDDGTYQPMYIGDTNGSGDGTLITVDDAASKIEFSAANIDAYGSLNVKSSGYLTFYDADASNYVAFRGPTALAANTLWTLPSADGSANQVLTTNGSGTLSWSTPSGGSSVTSFNGLTGAVTGVSRVNGFTGGITFAASTGITFTASAGTITLSTTGGGGSKTYAVYTPLDNQPPAANFATIDTRNSIMVLDFDAATDESAVFVGVIPEAASLGSGLKIRINWMATSATSGTCRWGVQIERMNTDEDSDSFDTAATAGSTTNGTSGIITTTEITITTIDSVAAGDPFRLKVFRDADGTSGTDDMTGDAELVSVEVRSAS